SRNVEIEPLASRVFAANRNLREARSLTPRRNLIHPESDRPMKINYRITNTLIFASVLMLTTAANATQLEPGDLVTSSNWYKVAGLVSPGNLVLVRQGMAIRVV